MVCGLERWVFDWGLCLVWLELAAGLSQRKKRRKRNQEYNADICLDMGSGFWVLMVHDFDTCE